MLDRYYLQGNYNERNEHFPVTLLIMAPKTTLPIYGLGKPKCRDS